MENNYLEQKKNTHLYFQVGEHKYAISSDNVLEIMKLPALDYPQKLPYNIVGLLKYNSFVINIIDIRLYLDMEITGYTTQNELIIAKTDEIIIGIIVDKTFGLLPFDIAQMDSIPFNDKKLFIESLYKFENETIYTINIYTLEKILKDKEYKEKDVNIPALFPQDNESKEIFLRRTKDRANKAALRLYNEFEYISDKYLSINLNHDFYCVSLQYVKEILKDVPITKVPGTPRAVAGIMNLRGDYITVIDLKELLSLPNENNNSGSIITIEVNDIKIALLIDKINEIFDYVVVNAENGTDSYYLTEFLNEDILYTVLNIEKIVHDKKIIVSDI